ncbi:MAG: aldose epimerase family protein [Opitutae bacterium]
MKLPLKIAGALTLAALLAPLMTSLSAAPNVTAQPFGTVDGQAVQLYTLRNASGAEATITNYGGIVVTLVVPDRHGQPVDVVLGYEQLAGYLQTTPYFGALIGRYGNRIAGGKFTLEGKTYPLAKNDKANTLHGGTKGFDKVVWQARVGDSKIGAALELSYRSKDGEEGYPGNLDVKAVYTLTNDNALRLDITAHTDQTTVLNLTHHSYFNLGGRGDVLDHLVTINADRFTPVGSGLIPTGELRAVAGTPFDFRQSTAIGARINAADEQLKAGGGYDHNWIVNQPQAGELGLQARVECPRTGIVLEVSSTEPAVQFYSGNFLDGSITGKRGQVYARRNAFCFEPQHYPDSPNQPAFPSTVLHPGQTYTNTIVYRLSVAR